MKLLMRSLLAAVLLLLLILLPNPVPAKAGPSMAPGFYSGWVSFSARTDETDNPPRQDARVEQFEIQRIEGRGQLMVKINDAGAGGASIVLPTATNMLFYTNIVGQGDIAGYTCTMSASVRAKSNYVHLRGAPAAMGDTFQTPFNPTAGLYFTSEHQASFGNLGGCTNFSEATPGGMKMRINDEQSVITAIQFQVKYQTDTDMGGTCSFPGWLSTTPVEGGQVTFTLPQCNWRVFKNSQTNPQPGWK